MMTRADCALEGKTPINLSDNERKMAIRDVTTEIPVVNSPKILLFFQGLNVIYNGKLAPDSYRRTSSTGTSLVSQVDRADPGLRTIE